ncbi:MAG: 2-oxoacid:acceptor oxidoreductase family protein [Nevskiales bacterium]|nr:2-oxoacid:acceptor oxidoreductase family protein [Nevskiales bacterium]
MIEVRVHGRGGQGNVVAAYLLATAAIEHGWHALAFPAFGAERRGAPVAAFVRMAEQSFRRRDQIAHPDFLIVQDDALLHVPGILAGLKPGGGILINSRREASTLDLPLDGDVRVQSLPANELAMEHLGRPLPNAPLLAAFLLLSGALPVDALKQAYSGRFHGGTLDANLKLIDAAAQYVRAGAWQEGADAASA